MEYTDIDTLSGRDPLKARPRYFFIARFFTHGANSRVCTSSVHLRLPARIDDSQFERFSENI